MQMKQPHKNRSNFRLSRAGSICGAACAAFCIRTAGNAVAAAELNTAAQQVSLPAAESTPAAKEMDPEYAATAASTQTLETPEDNPEYALDTLDVRPATEAAEIPTSQSAYAGNIGDSFNLRRRYSRATASRLRYAGLPAISRWPRWLQTAMSRWWGRAPRR